MFIGFNTLLAAHIHHVGMFKIICILLQSFCLNKYRNTVIKLSAYMIVNAH